MTTNILFELPDPAYEQHTWLLQDEHGSSSLAPLLIRDHERPSSSESLPSSLWIHGFNYVRVGPRRSGPTWAAGSPPPARSAEDLRRWRTDWLPEVEKVVQVLEEFDPATVPPGQWAATINAQEDHYMYVFGGIHRTAPGPAHAAYRTYAHAFEARFGKEREADKFALLQGIPNVSLERAGALWDLSRLLRASPDIGDALDRGAELPDTPTGREFRDGLAEMLAVYGHTTNNDQQDMPVWREDPRIPLAAIRAYALQDDSASPREAAARQRARRLELEAKLRELAEKGDEQVAAILTVLPAAQELMPNLEDHNFLADQRQLAASRRRWMSIGRHLQERGLLKAPEEVFFLLPEELIPVLEGLMTPDPAAIAERQRLTRLSRAAAPPPVLGRPLEQDGLNSEIERLAGNATRVIRGVPASSGVYRGRARVIESLEDASTLERGDVLIARTTTPPWTPFFPLISALVTNSGGMLSHSSVVAREFGIPAVIGTQTATVQIPDGAMVTVDGTSGLVLVE